MNKYKNIILPKIKNPIIFENICVDVLCEYYSSEVDFELYGRNGQEQHGIDVVSCNPDQNHGYIVAQCKNYISSNSKRFCNVIDDDFLKMKNLPFDVSKIFVMTSLDRDKDIQNHMREEYGERNVCILFWDDISGYILSSKDLMKKYYPALIPVEKKVKKSAFITNTPFSPCPYYIGRESTISNLYDKIVSGQSLVVTGIGGIGKTELIKKVLQRIQISDSEKTGITSIGWVDYDNVDIFACISKAFLETAGIKNLEEAWQKALKIIYEQREELLLVIDNVETLQDHNLLRLSQLPCRIVITSRVTQIGDFESHEVKKLSEKECMNLFRKYCKRHEGNEDLIREIVLLADCHTVTVELLAKIANLEDDNLSLFLEKLREAGFHLSQEEVAASHEKLLVEDRIIEQISKLFSVSFISGEMHNLLLQISVIPSLPFSFKHAKAWLEQKNRKYLNRLAETGWINREDLNGVVYYQIHSVIAAAVRYQNKDILYKRCKNLIQNLTKEMQYPADEHGARKIQLTQFAWSVNDLLRDHMQEIDDADFLLYLSRIYMDIANYSQAYALLRRCIRIYGRQESTIVKLISCYNQIGCLYREQDLFVYALTQYVKAFKLADKYQVENSLWATLYADAALVFLKTDGPEENGYADNYFRISYQLSCQVYGNNHYESRHILSLWNHCIVSYNPYLANQNYIEIIRQEEQEYEKNHPQLAETYATYALFLYDMGEFIQALHYTEAAYEIKKCYLASNHPELIDLKNNSALIHQYMGDIDKAKQEFSECLDELIQCKGENHPFTATMYNNLANIDFDMENYESALELFTKAKEIYFHCQEIYGNPYNEDISYIIRNAGQCYTEIAGREIYRIWKEHRKATDEETIFIHENLNLALNSLGEALTLLQQDPSRFGFDIAQIYGAAALVYEKKGEFDEAEKCFHRAIHDTILYRNETHPKLAHLYHNYGLMLDSKGRTQEAVDNLRLAENILIINGVDENSDNYQTVKMAIDAILNSM